MKDELIALAKEATSNEPLYGRKEFTFSAAELEHFANLVAAKEREKVANWMMQRALATGHGDTIEDMLVELEWQVREKEREACAKVCEEQANNAWSTGEAKFGDMFAAKIRARKP